LYYVYSLRVNCRPLSLVRVTVLLAVMDNDVDSTLDSVLCQKSFSEQEKLSVDYGGMASNTEGVAVKAYQETDSIRSESGESPTKEGSAAKDSEESAPKGKPMGVTYSLSRVADYAAVEQRLRAVLPEGMQVLGVQIPVRDELSAYYTYCVLLMPGGVEAGSRGHSACGVLDGIESVLRKFAVEQLDCAFDEAETETAFSLVFGIDMVAIVSCRENEDSGGFAGRFVERMKEGASSGSSGPGRWFGSVELPLQNTKSKCTDCTQHWRAENGILYYC
jgi:hypothetical protein